MSNVFVGNLLGKIKYVYYANTREQAKKIGFDDSFIYDEVNKSIEERSIFMKKINSLDSLISFELWNDKKDKIKY